MRASNRKKTNGTENGESSAQHESSIQKETTFQQGSSLHQFTKEIFNVELPTIQIAVDRPRSAQLDNQHSYLYLNILQEILDRFTHTSSHIERTLQEWSDSTAHKLLEALHKQQDGTHEHIRASAIQEAELKLAEMKLQNEQLHKTMVALREKHVKELAEKPPNKKRRIEHQLEHTKVPLEQVEKPCEKERKEKKRKKYELHAKGESSKICRPWPSQCS